MVKALDFDSCIVGSIPTTPAITHIKVYENLIKGGFILAEANNIQTMFDELYALDVSGKIKQKGGLDYLSWASALAILKNKCPDATITVHENIDGRFWFDDEKSAWCKVTVSAFGISHTQILPVMDFRNKALPADKVDAVEANKCMQRCIAKAIAVLSGIGLKIYEGEDTTPSKGIRATRQSKNDAKSSTSSELKKKQDEVTRLGKELISSGVSADAVRKVIGDANGGQKNPNKIGTIDLCEQIIGKLRELKS